MHCLESLDSVLMFNSQAESMKAKTNEAGSLKLPKNGTCIAWNLWTVF